MPSLVDRYNEPHRHYHTMQHIQEMHDLLEETIKASFEIEGQPIDQSTYETLRLAIWYHDAVYDTSRDDNEERSLDLAKSELTDRGVDPYIIEGVMRLIHSTAEHVPQYQDEKILSDLDLAIFGSDRYSQYVQQVREEYGMVSDDAWRVGRSGLLKKFLERPQIFYYLTRLEKRARANIQWELSRLELGA
jgi:predicted metal-dependent HD superfamily phosphohydrolase